MNAAPVQILVAGAQKAGTTSLASYLDHHPSLVGHATPELPYFVDDGLYQQGWDSVARHFYDSVELEPGQLRVAKSAGVCFLPVAAARAHHHNPQMRVLVVLREPVQRAFSAYGYFVARGLEAAETFSDALTLEAARLAADFGRHHHFAYFHRGLYAVQLQRLLELFGPEQVHVSVFEEFIADPQRSLMELCDWLGVNRFSEHEAHVIVSRRHNVTETVGAPRFGLDRLGPVLRRLPVAPSTRVALRSVLTRPRSGQRAELPPAVSERLRARFAEPNEDLYRLLGRRIAAWEDDLSAAVS